MYYSSLWCANKLTIEMLCTRAGKVPCNMHKHFNPRCVQTPNPLTAAEHRQIFVDATEDETRIGSFAAAEKGTRAVMAQAATDASIITI